MCYNLVISRLRINYVIRSLTLGSGIADDDDKVSRGQRLFAAMLCFSCAVAATMLLTLSRCLETNS